jgi:hypothetical protein
VSRSEESDVRVDFSECESGAGRKLVAAKSRTCQSHDMENNSIWMSVPRYCEDLEV